MPRSQILNYPLLLLQLHPLYNVVVVVLPHANLDYFCVKILKKIPTFTIFFNWVLFFLPLLAFGTLAEEEEEEEDRDSVISAMDIDSSQSRKYEQKRKEVII